MAAQTIRWLPPAHYGSGLLARNGNPAVGWLIPQPWVVDAKRDRVRFDDVVGGTWTVVHTGTDTSAQAWRSAGVPVIGIAAPGSAPGADRIVDCDGTLTRWLHDKKTSIVALRAPRPAFCLRRRNYRQTAPPSARRLHCGGPTE